MKRSFTQIELYLSRLLVLSASVLWYPLGSEEGIKAHHLIIFLLSILATFSGNLIHHIYHTARGNPVFAIGILGWLLTLLFTTMVFNTTWSPAKVISFFLQVVLGNYAIYRIMQDGGIDHLKRLLNLSLFFFLFPFLFLTGVPVGEVFDIVIRTVANADPKIIIFEFMAKAPLFQSFSEDGLDGLRHTISMYFVLVLLVNFLRIRNFADIAIVMFLIFLLIVFQSRSAWAALTVPFLAFIVLNVIMRKKKIAHWILIILGFPLSVSAVVFVLGPLILNRVESTDSYVGRIERFGEAWDFLGDFSLAPITLSRMFGSSHMFIFDSYYSGGLIGFLFAVLVAVAVFSESLPRKRLSQAYYHLGFIFGFPLFVRLFTAGSGLPGIGATMAFSVALYLNAMYRAERAR